MTLFITETNLTSDPQLIANFLEFHIDFSMMSVPCRIHRFEVMEYIRQNRLCKGDTVLLQGVYMSAIKPGDAQYISINYIELQSVQSGKKRKLLQMQQELLQNDAMSIVSSPALSQGASTPPQNEKVGGTLLPPNIYREHQKAEYTFIEITGCFREYFFMLYGQASYVCELYIHSINNAVEKQKARSEMTEMIHDNLASILALYDSMMKDQSEKREVKKSNLVKFVNSVKGLMIETLGRFKKVDNCLPALINIDSRIPLPSFIYDHYINKYA